MQRIITGILIISFIHSIETNKVYIALQALDKVGIYNVNVEEFETIEINYVSNCTEYSEMDCYKASECEWMLGMCMDAEGNMNMGNHTPHFIIVDEINKFWFVTTISSGFVGRYNLETDELIDRIFIGDSPALMALNITDFKLYVSRMMPIVGMMTGSESTIIQEIDYSDANNMYINTEFNIESPSPHGLSINSSGSEVYVASNTADWLWKINTITGCALGYLNAYKKKKSYFVSKEQGSFIRSFRIKNIIKKIFLIS